MQITYYIDDGYVGSESRPHRVDVYEEDMEDMSEDQKVEYIDGVVQEDFQQNITFYWDRKQIQK